MAQLQARRDMQQMGSDGDALAGRMLGGCRLVRLVSAGGMGRVYLAEQTRLGDRLVAVKVVEAEDTGDDGTFQHIEERFMREAQVLGRLSHPNILSVYDSGVEGGLLYLVMQYAPDGSLGDALRGTAPYALRTPAGAGTVVEIVEQVAAALYYTHQHGIVHGDVKPGNVLVQREPDGRRRMLLADFGVARGAESTAVGGQITGTVSYMAPEQFGGGFSPASDQYALGVVAYQLLTGRTPFSGGMAEVMRAHLYDTPAAVGSLNPDAPVGVGPVIARALAKEPKERYPTVMAFAQALRAAVEGLGIVAAAGVAGADERTVGGDEGTVADARTRPAMAAGAQAGAGALLIRPRGRAVAVGDGSRRGALAEEATVAERGGERRRRALALALCCALFLAAGVVALDTKSVGVSRGFAPKTLTRATATVGAQATQQAQQQATAAATQQPIAVQATPMAPSVSSGKAPTPTATSVQSVTAADGARLLTMTAPRSVAPGQHFTVAFTLQNTGATTWSDAAGYRLVCDTLRAQGAYCPQSLSVMLGGYAVGPGRRVTYTLALIAPMTVGAYTLALDLAHNGALFPIADVAPTFAVALPAATSTPVPAATNTPAPAPTHTPAPAPTNTPVPAPTRTPAPTPTSTPAPTQTPAPAPTQTPIPAATQTPIPAATSTPAPAPTPPPAATSAPTQGGGNGNGNGNGNGGGGD